MTANQINTRVQASTPSPGIRRAASGPTSGTIGCLEGSHHRPALYYASRDRRQEHPERHLKTFTGILQADAYGGYNPLFKVDRDPCPLTQALCWAHSRRKFFVLADIAANAKRGKNAAPISPMALEAVKGIDGLFDIEREINGLTADLRLELRRKDSLPLVDDLQVWLQTEREKLSRSSPVTEAIDYSSSVGMASRHSRTKAGFP